MKTATAIAIDFDGVLANTNVEKARLIHARFGRSVDPRRCCRTLCVPDVLTEQEYGSISQIAYSPSYTREMGAVPGAVEALAALQAAGWETVVLTARSGERCVAAREWLHHRLGTAAPRVYSSSGLSQSKAEWAAGNGAWAIVDDDPRHLVGVVGPVPKRYLFNPPDDVALAEGVTAVRGWKELLEHLALSGD